MRKITLTICGLLAGFAIAANAQKKDTKGSLYERLGGMPAVRVVVDDLVSRILADGRVNQWFAHAASSPEAAAAYKAKLADFVCQATGGPCKYTGLDMEAAHKGRGITAKAFNAVVENLMATLAKLQVAEKEQKQLISLLAPLKAAVVQR
jgi:hemoglobin